MTTEPLFVARLKKGGFTRTGTVDEVMALLDQLMPIDMLYCLSPLPAGNGYALVEAGIPIIDIQTIGQNANPKANTPSIPRVPDPISNGPLPSPRPPSRSEPISQSWAFENGLTDEPGFKFDKPKSQAELGNEPLPPSPPKKEAKRKTKPKRAKKEKDISDEDLPTTVSKGGTTKITHISTATPEQAERASKFGKSH